MPLNLNDLMKKANDKGITPPKSTVYSGQLIRPWQQESTLFEPSQKSQPNWQQIDNKTNNKPAAVGQHSDSKPLTNRYHSDTILEATENKEATKATTKIATKLQQTGNKSVASTSFSSLVGLQRAIMLFMYNECKMARSKTTESLTLEHISMALKTSKGCIKTTIQRLESKGFIERVIFKNGRGGWSKYSIKDLLFQELLQHESSNKATANWQQIDNKQVAQPITQPTTSSSIVSSSYIYNNYIYR
jgi:predicted transcriptional regulator